MDTIATVLVADDDAVLRKTFSAILRAKGYAVTRAATGQEEAAAARFADLGAEMAEEKPSLEPAAQQPLILLAEDDEINVDTVSDYLTARGYRVIVASNGIEAIDLARKRKPDLILMDIQMPEMDGLEAIRLIRADADPEVIDIPIIALTALAMSGDQERCLEAGADAYHSKPVSLRGLVRTIEAHTAHATPA